MCLESLLLHPPLAAEALEDPRLEPFHEVTGPLDDDAVLAREVREALYGWK
jgi:hypothetical protein